MKSALLTIFLSLALASAASAEVRFGPFSWIIGERTLAVIAPKGDGASGVFIAVGQQGVVPQELSPKAFLSGKGPSLFLSFDRRRATFTSLVLSSGKRLPIGGGVTIQIGEARVSISPGTVHLDHRLWTMVEGQDLIRGFIGLQEVFKYRGAQYVQLLEANQSNSLSRFELTEKGLLLGGREFAGERLGLELETNNSCLTADLVDTEGRPVKRGQGWLVYRVLSREFYVFDLLSESFGVVKEVGDPVACVFSAALEKGPTY